MTESSNIYSIQLSKAEFDTLGAFIYKEFGIRMPAEKRIMLQSRLHKRLRVLNMTSFKEYIEFVFSKEGAEEVIHMVDVVSTNKTDFYREPVHFDFLSKSVLPQIVEESKYKPHIQIWSSACSSGEEPYTIAMVLEEFRRKHSDLDYSILGTDISTDILKRASDAIYKEQRVEGIPLEIKKSYMLKSKDKEKKLVRMIPELRKKMTFQRLNLMDLVYNVRDDFDIIFCRNVLIYFERTTQEKVINKLCRHLKPGGYFLLGHSESIIGMEVPLTQIKPTIFRRN